MQHAVALDWTNRSLVSLGEMSQSLDEDPSSSCVTSIDASRNRLSTLVVKGRRAEWMGHVKHLTATNNQFASLAGIERWGRRSLQLLDVSNNGVPLRALDSTTTTSSTRSSSSSGGAATAATTMDAAGNGPALQQLLALTTLRASNCGIETVRLLPWSSTASMPSRAMDNASPFGALRELLLSHNALSSLPDVSGCTHLRVLHLSFNDIQSLDGLEHRLPHMLQELTLDNNALAGGLAALVPLTCLAETLSELRVGEGNPDCVSHRGAAGVWWRAIVCWLVPHVLRLDLTPVTPSDAMLASRLFRASDASGGALSEALVALLDEGRDAQLHAYLKSLPLLHPDDASSTSSAAVGDRSGWGGGDHRVLHHPTVATTTNSSRSQSPQPPPTNVRRGRTAPPSVPHHPLVVSPWSSEQHGHHNGTGRTEDIEDVVVAMQRKLRTVETVARELWHVDLRRRHRAATVIQATVRGYLFRRRLPRSTRQRLRLVHNRAVRAKAKPWMSDEAIAAQTAAASLTTTTPSPAGSVVDVELQQQLAQLPARIKGMDALLRQLWSDAAVVKHFVFLQHKKAATLIQKRYRAYRARQVWKAMRSDYERFQRQFLPTVQLLQDAGRRFMARRRLVLSLQRDYEARALRSDVAALKDTVRGLQHTVQLLLRERRVASLQAAAASATAAAASSSTSPVE